MRGLAKDTTATLIPTLRYRDAASAIGWLCTAFGFEKRLVVLGEDGTIAHAQLTFGNGMVMLGSARDDDFGNRSLCRTPRSRKVPTSSFPTLTRTTPEPWPRAQGW